MSKVERYRLITEYPKDEFFDNKQVVKFDAYEVIRTLNQQSQRIAELEEQLKNAIVPKFKIGQEVWWIDTRINSFNEQRYIIQSYIIQEITIFKDGIRYMDDDGFIDEEDLFATKEQAQAKLEELKGE